MSTIAIVASNSAAIAEQNISPSATSAQPSIKSEEAVSAQVTSADHAKANKALSISLVLWQSGDYSAAAVGLKQVLEIDPGNVQANYYYGDCLLRAHQRALAKPYLVRAVALGVDTAEGMKAQARLSELDAPVDFEDMTEDEISRAYEGIWVVSVAQYFKDFDLNIVSVSNGNVTSIGKQHECTIGSMNYTEGTMTNGHLRLKGHGACGWHPVFDFDLIDQNTMTGALTGEDTNIQATARRQTPATGLRFARRNPPNTTYASSSASPLTQALVGYVIGQSSSARVASPRVQAFNVAPASSVDVHSTAKTLEPYQHFRPLSDDEANALPDAPPYNERCANRDVPVEAVPMCKRLLNNITFLVEHKRQTIADWQKSATSTPALTVLSDGPITGHRVARSTYTDADGRLKGDIVVWADPKDKNFATIQIGISNNTPCKMHPNLTIYIGDGSSKMPVKTLSWGDSPLVAHDKRTFGPAEITNSSGEPMTFDGGAWFSDCQVALGG